MRITLIHNPEAGDESHSADRIRDMLAQAGHKVHLRSTEKGWKKALDRPADLVVVAGGDGTVGMVAMRLAHGRVPLAVLPTGTANNIGKTLGVMGDAREIIAGWAIDDRRPFDLGIARASSDEATFVESAGGGVFAELIASGKAVSDRPLIVGRETDRALHVLERILEAAEPAPWGVELDGHDLSGDYLAVEILNTRFAGPNVPLARGADPGDGLLDLVMVGDADREALLGYIRARLSSASGELAPFPVHQGRSIRLVAPAGVPFHLDDEPWAGGAGTRKRRRDRTIEIRVDPRALEVVS